MQTGSSTGLSDDESASTLLAVVSADDTSPIDGSSCPKLRCKFGLVCCGRGSSGEARRMWALCMFDGNASVPRLRIGPGQLRRVASSLRNGYVFCRRWDTSVAAGSLRFTELRLHRGVCMSCTRGEKDRRMFGAARREAIGRRENRCAETCVPRSRKLSVSVSASGQNGTIRNGRERERKRRRS